MQRTDDPSNVGRQKTKAKVFKNEDDSRISAVISSYEGRAMLWDILECCRIFTKGYVEGNLAYYNQGRRDVGLELIERINEIDKDVYARMSKEAIERDNVRRTDS